MGNILVTVIWFAHAFVPIVPEILPDKWMYHSFVQILKLKTCKLQKGNAAKIRMTNQHNQNRNKTVDALFIFFDHTSPFTLSEIDTFS